MNQEKNAKIYLSDMTKYSFSKSVLMNIHTTHHIYKIALRKKWFWIFFLRDFSSARGSSGSFHASFFFLQKILAGKSFPELRTIMVVIRSDRAPKISLRRFLMLPPSLNAISMIAKSAKPSDDFLTSHDGIVWFGDVKTSEIPSVMF